MKWTTKEVQILVKCNGKYSLDELVKITKHPFNSVTGKIQQLKKQGIEIKTNGSFGISRTLWTEKDIDILHQVGPTKTVSQIKQDYLPNFSEKAIRIKCFHEKIKCLPSPTHHAKGEKSWAWKGYNGLDGQRIATYRLNAKRRNIPFEISAEYLWRLLEKQNFQCALSGVSLYIRRNDTTASPDRIDSTKGYIEGNIQWVHKRINDMKRNDSDETLIDWCKKIVKYNENKQYK